MNCHHNFQSAGTIEAYCATAHRVKKRALFRCIICGAEGTAEDVRMGKLRVPGKDNEALEYKTLTD